MTIDITIPENNDEICLIAKKETQVVGFIRLVGCEKNNTKAVYLKELIFDENNTATGLLSEALMRAWETGYEAAFADREKILLESGFNPVKKPVEGLPHNGNDLIGFDLTWSGVAHFIHEPLNCK